MRNFVSGENKDEKTTGRILVGTMNIKPSGIGTSLHFSRMYVFRSASFELISWSSSPTSRQRSAAQGFSVRKESGPASTTHPSTNSVEITPQVRAGFVKNIFQGHSRAAALLERDRGGKSRNTAADDCN